MPPIHPTPPQLQLLKDKIDKHIKNINDSRIYYRTKAFSLYISTTVLSALVTVILGLGIHDLDAYSKGISLLLSALITVLSAYNTFFNHKELWTANNNALNKFYELRFNIEFREQGASPLSQTEVDDFRKNYQLILDELNATWAKSRS